MKAALDYAVQGAQHTCELKVALNLWRRASAFSPLFGGTFVGTTKPGDAAKICKRERNSTIWVHTLIKDIIFDGTPSLPSPASWRKSIAGVLSRQRSNPSHFCTAKHKLLRARQTYSQIHLHITYASDTSVIEMGSGPFSYCRYTCMDKHTAISGCHSTSRYMVNTQNMLDIPQEIRAFSLQCL